jgi:hypothetical protein
MPGNPPQAVSGTISRHFFSNRGVAMAGEEETGKGFTVQDRRRFSPETGEAREDARESRDSAQVESAPGQKDAGQDTAEAQEPLPAINFSTFIISLSTQALMHLGEIADPLSGKDNKDIPVAKQMIDIIGMLKDKTKGHLDAGEERLTEDILFDLRMKYVEAVKKK